MGSEEYIYFPMSALHSLIHRISCTVSFKHALLVHAMCRVLMSDVAMQECKQPSLGGELLPQHSSDLQLLEYAANSSATPCRAREERLDRSKQPDCPPQGKRLKKLLLQAGIEPSIQQFRQGHNVRTYASDRRIEWPPNGTYSRFEPHPSHSEVVWWAREGATYCAFRARLARALVSRAIV
jgi:hypothetical protein